MVPIAFRQLNVSKFPFFKKYKLPSFRFESYLGSQIGRRSLESAPAAFFLCQVVFVIASRSNGWRNVAVRVWSFQIEFEHTKKSNFRFSLNLAGEAGGGPGGRGRGGGTSGH